MSFWGNLGQVFGAGGAGTGTSGGDSGGGGWSTWGPLIAKTGLGVLGGVLNARAYNQPEKWRQGIIESEIARRNALQSAAAPTLAGMLGYRTPAMGQQLQGVLGGKSGATGATGTYTSGVQPSTAGKVGSIAGGAIGAAFGGPLGASLGSMAGGSLGKIGAGRRAANGFVQGTENAFGRDLASIAEMAKTDPAGAANLFKQKYGNYMASVNQSMTAGGNQAKVAQQSLNNPQLRQTYTTLAQQLGVTL